MERIVALVEGHTEQHFIRGTFANAIVQRPFPNGRDVSVDLIVDAIRDALETVGGDVKRVIILLDREERPLSCNDFRNELVAKVTSICSGRKIYFGVSDRQIENWILSDEAYIQKTFKQISFQYSGDGSYGKKALETVSNHFVKSPSDKARHLKAISAQRGAKASASLSCFLQQIDFDWFWAKK